MTAWKERGITRIYEARNVFGTIRVLDRGLIINELIIKFQPLKITIEIIS